METIHKKILRELDLILAKAPDADIEREFTAFCEMHEAYLYDEKHKIEDILPRLLLVYEIIKFQKDFMLGLSFKESLSKILNHAKMMGREDLFNNFSSKSRMEQMSKILENKSVDIFSEQLRKSKNA